MDDSTKSGMEISRYAEQVASDVLGSTEGLIWRGAWASMLHFFLILLPGFLLVSVCGPLLEKPCLTPNQEIIATDKSGLSYLEKQNL